MHQQHNVVFITDNYYSQHDLHREHSLRDGGNDRRVHCTHRSSDSRRGVVDVMGMTKVRTVTENMKYHHHDDNGFEQQHRQHQQQHQSRGYVYTTNLINAGLGGELLFLDVPNHGYYIRTCLQTFVPLFVSSIGSENDDGGSEYDEYDDNYNYNDGTMKRSKCGFVGPFVGPGVHRVARKKQNTTISTATATTTITLKNAATKNTTSTVTDGAENETQEEEEEEETFIGEEEEKKVRFLFIVRKIEKSRKNVMKNDEMDVYDATYAEKVSQGLSPETARDFAEGAVRQFRIAEKINRGIDVDISNAVNGKLGSEEDDGDDGDDGIPQFEKVLHSELNKLYFDGRMVDTQPMYVVVPYHQGIGTGFCTSGQKKEHEVDLTTNDVSAYNMWSSTGQPMRLVPSTSQHTNSSTDATTSERMDPSSSSPSSSSTSSTYSSQQASRQYSKSNSKSASSEPAQSAQLSGSDSSSSSSVSGSQSGAGSGSGGGEEERSSSSLRYADVDDWIKRVVQRDKFIKNRNKKKKGTSSTRKRKNGTNGKSSTTETRCFHPTNTVQPKTKTKTKYDDMKLRRGSGSDSKRGTTGGTNRSSVGTANGRDLQQIDDRFEELINHDIDIELVMGETGCSREIAIYALRENDGCVVDACLSATTRRYY